MLICQHSFIIQPTIYRQRCKISSKFTHSYSLNFHLDAKYEEIVKKILKILLALT